MKQLKANTYSATRQDSSGFPALTIMPMDVRHKQKIQHCKEKSTTSRAKSNELWSHLPHVPKWSSKTEICHF